MRITIIAAVFLAVAGVSAAFGQNRFEGYNLVVDVPTSQRAPACAVRYVPANTIITITDLDRATPMDIKPCAGSGTTLVQSSAGSVTFRANTTTNKWCFTGADKRYRITLTGDQFAGTVSYDWIAEPDPREAGFFNIRDFGAVGDGRTDDTDAFRSAMAYIASRNGGTVRVPDGEYIVSGPIALPSGITLEGSTGLHSMASTSDIPRQNPVRITLEGSNRSLFRIGECVENVTLRNIELFARSNNNTNGLEAIGAFNSSQGFVADQVIFHGFNRGINAYGLPQTNLNWQFDYVKIINSRFIYNRDTGIFVNSRNTDWKIEGCFFLNPRRQAGQAANSMHFERVGMVIVQDTFGGGFTTALGGTFINILDSGSLTIIGSQTEAMTNSLVYNEVENPGAGDYSYPITIVNSIFEHPMIFKARRTLVSTGNLYGARTFQADYRVRVYSTGDRFCYDGYILGCTGGTPNNFDKATVIFMTGQPGEGQLLGHPTYFGTDVRFGAPVQMPSFQQNVLPTAAENGTMVYCQNCRRNTTPCQAGGSGAPAMRVAGQWSCL